MRTSALFGAKNIRFFEFYGVSERVEQVRTRGEGSIFRDFVRTSLWTGPFRTSSQAFSVFESAFSVFKIYGVSARARREGGWGSADIFRTRVEVGQFFAILCGLFYAPYWSFCGGTFYHLIWKFRKLVSDWNFLAGSRDGEIGNFENPEKY